MIDPKRISTACRIILGKESHDSYEGAEARPTYAPQPRFDQCVSIATLPLRQCN
jgi:hypothetical protein